jgi:enediyne biosynthesis protein E4
MRFTDVTDEAGGAGVGYAMGVAAADYDKDGRVDLFVAGVRRNQLLRNRGDGGFDDVTTRAGIASGDWAVAAGWLDDDNDGFLD